MFKKSMIALLLLSSISLMGCGQKEYYNAVKEQNALIYSMSKQQESHEKEMDLKHNERMMQYITQAVTAASKTADKTDDVLVPMLIMNMENQQLLAKALQAPFKKQMALQTIKAPDSVGDTIAKSTGALLGAFGIYASIQSSHDLRDVANSAAANAGVHNTINGDGNELNNDSFKAASQNTINGDTNSVEGTESCGGNCDNDGEFDLQECITNPPGGYNADGAALWTPDGCSCDSHANGHC